MSSLASLWLIRVISVIVPQRLRADWRQEWAAELRYREAMLAEWGKLDGQHKLDLLRRSLGAFTDALWLQPRKWENEMWQDLRYGARLLVKNPGFTTLAVLTLALGIGATTGVFSAVNAVLLRPLPFAAPERLISLAETHPELPRLEVASLDFMDWQQHAQSFEALGAYSLQSLTKLVLTDTGEPEQLLGTCVTPNLLPLLGIKPMQGRNFLTEENQPGHDRVAIISYGLWQRRFAMETQFAGKTLRLNGEPYTVVGVLPQGVQLPFENDVWLPLSQLGTANLNSRIYHSLVTVARLKPGVTVAQARAEMEAIAARLQQAYPATNKTIGVALAPLQEQLTGEVRPALLALFGTVALVLLITCANVANLLLARAAQRQREVAVRAALGAGRGRLLRQFLTESLLLSLFGGTGGLLLAWWSVPLIRSALPEALTVQFPTLKTASVDATLLGFALLVTMLTGVLFGLIPAWQLTRLELNQTLGQTLKEGGKASAGRARQRASRALIVAEVALTTVALIGAGLLVRSFQRLVQVDPGFRVGHLLTAQYTLPATKYPTPADVKGFHDRLFTRLASVPGVQGAATIDYFPLAASNAKTRFAVSGATAPGPGRFPVAQVRGVSQDYFQVMGIALKGGRVFTADDLANNRNYFVINETLARRYFPNEDPVGKQLVMGVLSPQPTNVPIIGVVTDVKDLGLDAPAEPEIYFPGYNTQQLLMLRTTGDAASLAIAVREAVRAIDREQPLQRVRTMDEALAVSLARRRLSALLTGLFALLALVLAGVGIYGVLAWTVTERTPELGIRLVLGAQPSDLLRLVVGQGMKLTALGLGLGLVGALVTARLLKGLLFGVSAGDLLAFVAIPALLAVTALLACYLPARRAARVDPLVALRQD